MVESSDTDALISAGRVRGSRVYNTDGEELGEINDLMIDKRSGRIAYALMSFGGFLRMGERYHPLPWAMLKFDADRRRYVVGMSKAALKDAPCYGRDERPAWGDRGYEARIHEYYKTDPYWITPMP